MLRALYAPIDLETSVLDVQLQIPEDLPECKKNTQIIFCVDVSGSMNQSMPALKASLFAFRDTLIELNGRPATENDDRQFAQQHDVTLITFNNEARLVWSSTQALGENPDPNSSFTAAVLSLTALNSTNMGDGLQMAFQCVKPPDQVDLAVMLVLTDGESNAGTYRDEASFRQLVSASLQPHIKLFTIGYGQSYDAAILSAVGDFTFIPDAAAIPIVFGAILGEIETTFGLSAVVTLHVDHNQPGASLEPCFGSRSICSLFAGKRYHLGYWVHMPSFTGHVTLEYYDIVSRHRLQCQIGVQRSDQIDVILWRQQMYADRKNQLLHQLLARPQEERLSLVQAACAAWNDPEGQRCRQELVDEINRHDLDLQRLHRLSSDLMRQQSHSTQDNMTAHQLERQTSLSTQASYYASVPAGAFALRPPPAAAAAAAGQQANQPEDEMPPV